MCVSNLLLIEEVESLALVAGQLLQGAALLLDGGLDLGGGGVVLDVDRGVPRRLLGRSPRRAEQAAEAGAARGEGRGGERGGWREERAHRNTDRGVDTSGSRVPWSGFRDRGRRKGHCYTNTHTHASLTLTPYTPIQSPSDTHTHASPRPVLL